MNKQIRNTVLLLLCMIVIAAVLAGCESNDNKSNTSTTVTAAPTESATQTPTQAPTETPTPTEEPTPTPDDWYAKMVSESLMDDGCNARLKKVIDKARSGEDVYIATIGGSITEGAGTSVYENCYAALFASTFASTFGKDGGANVHFINAGLSGTPSTLGVIRYQRDVITKNDGHLPDLLVIEFAVNDADDPTNGATYEGLVRRALQAENEPAVILLFSVFKSRWNLQDRLKPIGTYYSLPMVSIKDAVVPRLGKKFSDQSYFADEYHPTGFGHKIMSACLMYLCETVDAQEAEQDVPFATQPLLGSEFDNVLMVEADTPGVTIDAGGFSARDTAVFSTKFESVTCFPDNWKHVAGASDEPLTITANCRSILVAYKKSSSANFGTAEIVVDGKVVKTVKGNEAGGWNNPYTLVVLREAEVGEHTLQVRMAEGSEDKEFTVLAVGLGQ